MPRFRHIETEIDWRGYEGDEVVLTVCHRSPAMQGRNFTSIIEAISKKVSHVHIMMCDTLDRYNENMDAGIAKKKANIWMNTNLSELTQNGLSYDVTRWNEVMADPSFKDRYKTMLDLYKNNDFVKQTIHNVCSFYVQSKQERASKDGLPFNLEKIREDSSMYLVEEFAGCPIYREWFNMPEVYWGVYIFDTDIFNRYNTINPSVDLTQPFVLPVSNNRLGEAIIGEHKVAYRPGSSN